VNVKSKFKSGIESMDTSPIPERFMKNEDCCVLFCFPHTPPPFSFLRKSFQNNSTMTYGSLNVFSVFFINAQIMRFPGA
jgi:hypothetical protein